MENVKDAKWVDARHTKLDCMYNHESYGWIPFTADSADSSPVSRYIFENINDIEVAEYVEPTIDLEAIRESKHQELRQTRDYIRKIEFASYNNDTFQIRQEDQDNMNTFYADSVAMLSGVVPREVFTIMTATNIPRVFTPEQIVQLAKIMKAKVEEVYGRYWYARDVLLANATTKEEIESIQFPSSLPTQA